MECLFYMLKYSFIHVYLNDYCFDFHPLLASNLKFTNWIVMKNMLILFQNSTTTKRYQFF